MRPSLSDNTCRSISINLAPPVLVTAAPRSFNSIAVKVLDFASCWSTQAFLVDTCLSVSFVSYFRLFLALSTQASTDLAVTCDALLPLLPTPTPQLLTLCSDTRENRFPTFVPISTTVNYLILVAIFAKTVLALWFLRPSRPSAPSSTVWLLESVHGIAPVPADLSRPFELVVVSVTLHSLLGFTLFASPLVNITPVIEMLVLCWTMASTDLWILTTAFAVLLMIWQGVECFVKMSSCSRITLPQEEDESVSLLRARAMQWDDKVDY